MLRLMWGFRMKGCWEASGRLSAVLRSEDVWLLRDLALWMGFCATCVCGGHACDLCCRENGARRWKCWLGSSRQCSHLQDDSVG